MQICKPHLSVPLFIYICVNGFCIYICICVSLCVCVYVGVPGGSGMTIQSLEAPILLAWETRDTRVLSVQGRGGLGLGLGSWAWGFRA